MSKLLIIGAHSDIAQAVAKKFASQGFDLVLVARKIERLDVLKKDLQIRFGCEVTLCELDIMDTDNHKKVFDDIKSGLSGALTAVGYLGDENLAQIDSAEALKIYQNNFSALACFLDIVAKEFESQKSGFIIGISSVAGDRGRKSNYHYGAAKAAFTAYLSGLRQHLFSAGVKVITVKPGFVNTQMTAALSLPQKLTAEPEGVAEDIFRGLKKNKSVIYSRWYWKWIMMIIKSIPEFVFKRLKL